MLHIRLLVMISCGTTTLLHAEPPQSAGLDQKKVTALLQSHEKADWVQAAKLIAQSRREAVDLLPQMFTGPSHYLLRNELNKVLAEASGARVLELFASLDERGKTVLVDEMRKRTLPNYQAVRDDARLDKRLTTHTLIMALPEAKSPLLRSSVLSTWWYFSDREQDIAPAIGDLLFHFLDDVRVDPNASVKVPPPTPREAAIEVLSSCNGQFDDRVYNMLNHDCAKYRAAAVMITTARGPVEKKALQRIFALTKDPDADVRKHVADALAMAGEEHEQAVVHLIRFLQNEASPVQQSAAQSLAAVVPKTAENTRATAADKLVALYQSNASIRWRTGMSLASIMPALSKQAQQKLVHDLIPHLDDDGQSGEWIWRAIAGAETNAKEALPQFRQRFRESNPKDKLEFARLMWRVEGDPQSVLAIFLAATQHKSSVQRYYGFRGLEEMGPAAKEAVPLMTTMLSHKKEIVIRQALDVLSAVGPAAAEAVPDIEPLLKSKSERVSEAAQSALQAIAE